MVQWHDEGEPGLTYDDVLLRPAYSELESRSDANPATQLYQDREKEGLFRWDISPIIAANMVDISTQKMMAALGREHIIVPAHRNQLMRDELADAGSLLVQSFARLPISVTVGLHDRERTEYFLKHGVDILFLELAHADTEQAVKEVEWIRSESPHVVIVAGNVATATATQRLSVAGADIVKVGIGPGSVCTTRLVTGCGVPQLSAVLECASVGVPIIADGGIKCSGDIVKALAAGARYVMIGSLFAGTDETNPERRYSGMASRVTGKINNGNIPEGISTTVPYKGSARAVAQELIAGLRQGMAMIGARTVDEIPLKAIFQRVSPATLTENSPHVLGR